MDIPVLDAWKSLKITFRSRRTRLDDFGDRVLRVAAGRPVAHGNVG
jgi:hypothetical protein